MCKNICIKFSIWKLFQVRHEIVPIVLIFLQVMDMSYYLPVCFYFKFKIVLFKIFLYLNLIREYQWYWSLSGIILHVWLVSKIALYVGEMH